MSSCRMDMEWTCNACNVAGASLGELSYPCTIQFIGCIWTALCKLGGRMKVQRRLANMAEVLLGVQLRWHVEDFDSHYWRQDFDLIVVFKILRDFENVDPNFIIGFFRWLEMVSGGAGQSFKLSRKRMLDVEKLKFANRVC